jgi:hypothetical protein
MTEEKKHPSWVGKPWALMTCEEKRAVHDFPWEEKPWALMTKEEALDAHNPQVAYNQIVKELSSWELLGNEEKQPQSWEGKICALWTEEEKLDAYASHLAHNERVKQFSWLVSDYGFEGTLCFVAEAFRMHAKRFDYIESSDEDRKVAHAWRRDARWLDRQARKPEWLRALSPR